MHILVTNDDGVLAPGLLALVKEMRQVGKVSVLAPEGNWSSVGQLKPIDQPLRIREVPLMDGTSALTSDGTPSDCVALALLGFFPENVDLVVSGINPNPNIGQDVTFSGTVTAAMEAVIWGVPAVSFSLSTIENHLGGLDYGPASQVARQVVQTVTEPLLPAGILLNVNIPYLPEDQIKGYRIIRQGLRMSRDRLDQRVDPRGVPNFWIGSDAPTGITEPGTNFGALTEGFVSINPFQLDLIAYPSMQKLDKWNWVESSSKSKMEDLFIEISPMSDLY